MVLFALITGKIFKQHIRKNFSYKKLFSFLPHMEPLLSLNKSELSEKIVFENLADTYNCIFRTTYFRWAEPILSSERWHIPVAIDSKTNNIILIRRIYKRDSPISFCLSWELYVSQSKRGISSNLVGVANQWYYWLLAHPIKKLWSSQWIKKEFFWEHRHHLQIKSNDDYIVV